MNDDRRDILAWTMLKEFLKDKFSLKQIAGIKRDIGNIVKKPGMVAVNATAEELLEFFDLLISESFEEQRKTLK